MAGEPTAPNSTRYNSSSRLLIIFSIALNYTSSTPSLYQCSQSLPGNNVTSSSGILEIVAAHPTEGFIASPNYPNPYPANQDCVYRLNALPAAALVIHLTFVDMDLGVSDGDVSVQ